MVAFAQRRAQALAAHFQQAGAEWFASTPEQKPRDIALAALDHARRHYFDVLLVDTAGRLGIDEALMAEIRDLHAVLQPIETLFVVDAMQGQDAVNTAKAFKDALPLTGVGVVDLIITDLAVMEVTPQGLKVVELAPGVTREFLQSKTGVTLL